MYASACVETVKISLQLLSAFAAMRLIAVCQNLHARECKLMDPLMNHKVCLSVLECMGTTSSMCMLYAQMCVCVCVCTTRSVLSVYRKHYGNNALEKAIHE